MKGEHMNQARTSLSLALVGLLGIGLASGARAETQSFGPATTDFKTFLTFNQFNPALGTLNSVSITLQTDFDTAITITNNSVSPSNGTDRTNVQDAITDGAINNASDPLTVTGGNFSVQDNFNSAPVSYNLAPGANTTQSPPHATHTVGPTAFSSAPVLVEFTGLGTINLNIGTFTQTFLANTGGNTSSAQSTTATMTGTVNYNFTPSTPGTPEPGVLAFLGAGVVGTIGAGLRRRKK
jgi:hypothetical protein